MARGLTDEREVSVGLPCVFIFFAFSAAFFFAFFFSSSFIYTQISLVF
jgi:hypothetical protein